LLPRCGQFLKGEIMDQMKGECVASEIRVEELEQILRVGLELQF